jgi:hypothetical protein
MKFIQLVNFWYVSGHQCGYQFEHQFDQFEPQIVTSWMQYAFNFGVNLLVCISL